MVSQHWETGGLATRQEFWRRAATTTAIGDPGYDLATRNGFSATATGTDHRIGPTERLRRHDYRAERDGDQTATMIGIGDKVDKARRLTESLRRLKSIGDKKGNAVLPASIKKSIGDHERYSATDNSTATRREAARLG